jgi:co-chaperonin GroES (HSP10)
MALAAMHLSDPADGLRNKVGSLKGFELFHNQVLVATYFRPEKSKGGIFLPEQVAKGDRFEGKIGLVLMTGPAAFLDDANFAFHGVKVHEGEWAVYRPSDGWECEINGQLCRILSDSNIKGRVAHPDMVF